MALGPALPGAGKLGAGWLLPAEGATALAALPRLPLGAAAGARSSCAVSGSLDTLKRVPAGALAAADGACSLASCSAWVPAAAVGWRAAAPGCELGTGCLLAGSCWSVLLSAAVLAGGLSWKAAAVGRRLLVREGWVMRGSAVVNVTGRDAPSVSETASPACSQLSASAVRPGEAQSLAGLRLHAYQAAAQLCFVHFGKLAGLCALGATTAAAATVHLRQRAQQRKRPRRQRHALRPGLALSRGHPLRGRPSLRPLCPSSGGSSGRLRRLRRLPGLC